MIGTAIFLDTETTGLPSKDFTPEIVQLAARLEDTESQDVLGEINLLVKPKHPIPAEVTNIHGITDDLVALFGFDSRITEGIFMQLAAKADVIVAHNLKFDMEIIKGAWPTAYALLQTKGQYCTMEAATPVMQLPGGEYHGTFFEHKPPKLSEAYPYFTGLELKGAHDAVVDMLAAREVFYGVEEAKRELTT